MGELVILFLGMLVLLCFSFCFSEKDFFSPSFISCGLFMVGIVLAIRDVNAWSLDSSIFSLEGSFILLSGMTVFVMTEFVTRTQMKNRIKKRIRGQVGFVDEKTAFTLKKRRIIYILIIQWALATLYCYEILKYTRINGYVGPFSVSRLALYRHEAAFSADSLIDMPRWVRFIKYYITANVYVYLYIFIRNVFYSKDKLVKNIIYMLFVFPMVPISALSGSRGELLQLMGAGVFMMYVMMRRSRQWSEPSKVFLKIVRKSGIIFFVTLLTFYLVMANGLFGRSTTWSFLDHITMYLGAPIIHFYQYLKDPYVTKKLFAQETFPYIVNSLYKFGFSPNQVTFQLEKRVLAGHTGNIYTFFRRPYHDFGLIGMYVVTAIVSLLFSYVYYKIIYGEKENISTDRILIAYSYYFYLIYLVPMTCSLCNLVGLSMVFIIVFINLSYRFARDDIKIFNKRIKFKKGVRSHEHNDEF